VRPGAPRRRWSPARPPQSLARVTASRPGSHSGAGRASKWSWPRGSSSGSHNHFTWQSNGAKGYQPRRHPESVAAGGRRRRGTGRQRTDAGRRLVLDAGESYTWWVRGRGYFDDWSSWSPTPRRFSTDKALVPLVTPSDGARSSRAWPITLTWGAPPAGGTGFEVDVSGPDDPSYASPIHSDDHGASAQWNITLGCVP